MRGFPPFRILIVIAAFALLAIPLWKLTHVDIHHFSSSEGQEAVEVLPAPESEINLVLRCAHAPESLTLFDSEGEIASFKNEKKWPQYIVYRTSRMSNWEIGVEAQWGPEVTSTAVTLELSPKGRETLSETRWSVENGMDDVFTFERK